ncbi:hypothetical protein B7494_g6505 [Chlorociboria aeruginascens]|nr:hypothetical protein B7494_g6505 [Chlorociboria aeruginascens]
MVSSRVPNEQYPPDLTPPESEHLVLTIKDWTIANGLAVRPPLSVLSAESDPRGVLATTAPLTLFPSPFPRVCFDQARSVQKAYNQLYASIAQDEEFLTGIVQEIIEVDDFIAKLWQVHLEVKKEGYVQDLCLGLFRSDYMVHQTSPEAIPTIKQVEFNTIASSFGGLSSQTSKLHKYLSICNYPLLTNEFSLELDLPENTSTESLASGIRVASDEYLKAGSMLEHCVIFLVQDPERNIFDQRHLEYELQQNGPPIPVFRLPFAEVLSHTSIADTPKRELLYVPPSNPSKVFEVAVVYFRACYGPQDYTGEDSWKGRLQIERSNAIKCPSILTQLAGAKKVQQVLATPTSAATPSILTRFVKTTAAEREGLEATFTNIFSLDETPAGLEARKIARDPIKCKGYVLKPQREGGGNNIYRSAIPPFLKSLPESHLKSYILMEIITPPPVHNQILRNGVIEKGGVICELGIYGTCLWNQKTEEVLHNEEAGYLLRTKGDQSEEGGVAAGFGAMDSFASVMELSRPSPPKQKVRVRSRAEIAAMMPQITEALQASPPRDVVPIASVTSDIPQSGEQLSTDVTPTGPKFTANISHCGGHSPTGVVFTPSATTNAPQNGGQSLSQIALAALNSMPSVQQNAGQPSSGVASAVPNATTNVSQGNAQSATIVGPTSNATTHIPYIEGQSLSQIALSALNAMPSVQHNTGQSSSGVASAVPNATANVPKNVGQLTPGRTPLPDSRPARQGIAASSSGSESSASQRSTQRTSPTSSQVLSRVSSTSSSKKGSKRGSKGGSKKGSKKGPPAPKKATAKLKPKNSGKKVAFAPRCKPGSKIVIRDAPALPFSLCGLTVDFQTAAGEQNEGTSLYRGDYTTACPEPAGKQPCPTKQIGVSPWAIYQILCRCETGEMTKDELYRVLRAWVPGEYHEWYEDGVFHSNEQTLRRCLTSKGVFQRVLRRDLNRRCGYWYVAKDTDKTEDKRYGARKKRRNPFNDCQPPAKKRPSPPDAPSSSTFRSSGWTPINAPK